MTKLTRERDIEIGEQSARPSTMIYLQSPSVPDGGDESPPLDPRCGCAATCSPAPRNH